MVDFSKELDNAAAVADRFENLLGRAPGFNRMAFIMDLLAADGCNGNPPLDWAAFLAADRYEFTHDAAGIYRHLDRATGQLIGCFIPRFVKYESPDRYERSAMAAGWQSFPSNAGGLRWMSPSDNRDTYATAKEACDKHGIPLLD